MTDFTALYKQKLTDAQGIAGRIESGWTLGMDAGPSQAPAIMQALCDRAENGALTGVTVHTMLDIYPYPFYEEDAL